jgi:phage baseplate assembly protein W
MATLNTRQFSDLDLNFNIHPIKKDINRLTNERAVISAVKNLLLTNHYERPFQPYIGSNIRALLFEPLDHVTATNIERTIQQTIDNFEPRVRIITIKVSPDLENNAFGVYMELKVQNISNPVSVNFLLERIR